MVRRIDELGRLVIPREIRNSMNITTGDLLKLELIRKSTTSLKLVITKEDELKECLGCGNYCNSNDNYCSSCGLDLNNH